MSDLAIGGDTFKVTVEGDAASPAVLLCHPLGGDHRIWDAQVPELSGQFRVVRYDARGHGGSTVAGGPYSITRLGLDALAVLDALEIEKAHVLGMSMGGAVAQWLMIHAPHRVERGILANTGATFGAAAAWNERIATARTEGMASLGEPTLSRWFGDAFMAENGAAIAPVRQTFLATAPEGYAASCAALRDLDLREGIRQIGHPVLVIAGRHDPSVGAAQTDFLADTIPNASLVTLEAYHIAHLGDAGGFTKAVLDFLTAKEPARRAAGRKPLSRLPVARRPAGRRTAATRGPAAARSATVAAAGKGKKPAPVKTAPATRAPAAKKQRADEKPATRRGRPPAAAAPDGRGAKARSAAASPAPKRSTPEPAKAATRSRPGRPAGKAGAARAVVPDQAAKTARQSGERKSAGRGPIAATFKASPARAKASERPAGKSVAPKGRAGAITHKTAPKALATGGAKKAAKPAAQASAAKPAKAAARAARTGKPPKAAAAKRPASRRKT